LVEIHTTAVTVTYIAGFASAASTSRMATRLQLQKCRYYLRKCLPGVRPTRALSGSYVVNWSLELIRDTANAQKKKLA